MMDVREKYRRCVDAMESYVRGAGFTDVVIGLSGGIDSAVVAVMAADAFGPDHVHGVLLPGPYSSAHSVEDAYDLAERLGIDACEISITEPFRAFEEGLAQACGGALSGLAAENTQARCRMVCIMALSNAHGWLMLNTGNKSESMMGYSTLYGDTAGAFAPLGGLYKIDVYAIANWVNEAAESSGKVAPIPQRTITKPPSAELAPDQEDERSMGVDYPTLDAILIAAMEQGETPDQIAASGYDAELVAYVLRRARSYAFKRAMEPPFPQDDFYAQ